LLPAPNLDMNSGAELWASHWTLTGTHRGEVNGIPAAGKVVTVSGVSIWKIVDGKNVEEWEIVDTMSMLQQLGVTPAPGEGEG
jgi:predicted ester cyclase